MHQAIQDLLRLAQVPDSDQARAFGFRFGDKGAHTSRTFMFAELDQVLESTRPDARSDDYVTAIVDDNVADKKTAATRRATAQRLRELYALDRAVPLFRVMRHLWDLGADGRPLLALLCAMARDPLLRASAPTIMAMQPGEELARQDLIDSIRQTAGNRLNDSVLDKVVRNVASTWTQTGHLQGRVRKLREQVHPTPAAVVYSLLMGYWLGLRGSRLFNTLWARSLDVSFDQLVHLATDAKRLGLIDLKRAGDVVEVAFAPAITDIRSGGSHGAN
jgi:hypothetical protein